MLSEKGKHAVATENRRFVWSKIIWPLILEINDATFTLKQFQNKRQKICEQKSIDILKTSPKSGKTIKKSKGELVKLLVEMIPSNCLEGINTEINNNIKSNNVKNIIVVTHLVVLRMIISKYIDIKLHNLFKINIKNLDHFKILVFKDYFMINLNKQMRKKLRKIEANV